MVIGMILTTDKSPAIKLSAPGVKFREEIINENRARDTNPTGLNGIHSGIPDGMNYNAYESFIRRAE